jgi:hypothetical protein
MFRFAWFDRLGQEAAGAGGASALWNRRLNTAWTSFSRIDLLCVREL